jgi:hypothetical protein
MSYPTRSVISHVFRPPKARQAGLTKKKYLLRAAPLMNEGRLREEFLPADTQRNMS